MYCRYSIRNHLGVDLFLSEILEAWWDTQQWCWCSLNPLIRPLICFFHDKKFILTDLSHSMGECCFQSKVDVMQHFAIELD